MIHTSLIKLTNQGLSDVLKIENHDFGPLLIPTELMNHV